MGLAQNEKAITIAVDFDGTLVTDKFPEIGEPITGCITFMKLLKEFGFKLILWTCRDNTTPEKNLDKAVEFCKSVGLEFDAVNDNLPEVKERWGNNTRKVFADFYLDDKCLSPDTLAETLDKRCKEIAAREKHNK